MLKHPRRIVLALLLSMSLAIPVHAAEPGLHEIYSAAESGHLDQAQTMIQEVLKAHPDSAKAHYVAAELDAKQGRLQDARQQLATAERLQPGLPFAKPAAVQQLRSELGQSAIGASMTAASHDNGGLPAGTLLLGLLIIGGLVFWLTRRRTPPAPTNAWPVSAATTAPAAPQPPMYGGTPGGGIGSSLGRGIATGLGIGAGLVAGEALADRLIHGPERETERETERRLQPLQDAPQDLNQDMGGNDFGISDGDSSDWDDSSSGADSDWS